MFSHENTPADTWDLKPEIENIHDNLEVNLREEDGFTESGLSEEDKKNIWYSAVDKYLASVEFAFDKGESTSKKVADALDNIPEPTSKKMVIQITLGLVLVVLIILLAK